MDFTIYMAAMWISEVFYFEFETKKDMPGRLRYATACRTQGIVRFDQTILGRIKVRAP